MKEKLITALFMAMSVAFPVALPATTYAACPGNNASTPKQQVLNGVGTTGGDCSGGEVYSVLKTVVNILSLIVGIAAVIMIIISGLKYITSGGDSNKVSSAKSGLIYALVGLAIAALAQVLVSFVLKSAAG